MVERQKIKENNRFRSSIKELLHQIGANKSTLSVISVSFQNQSAANLAGLKTWLVDMCSTRFVSTAISRKPLLAIVV